MRKTKFFSLLAISALVLSVTLTSCKKDTEVDPYEGKTNPSTIAESNLVAYFPFESSTESIELGTGISFDKMVGAASFVTGRRGNCYQGSSDEAYLQYSLASTNPFLSMHSFTIAAWIKSSASGNAAMIFQVNGGDGTMSNLDLMQESGSNADSLAFKGYLYSSLTTWQGQDLYLSNPAFTPNKWVHVVYSYNSTTSTEAFYANGVLLKTDVRYQNGDGVELGEITFADDMTNINIGAWNQQITGTGAQSWMGYFPGMLDELRIYNTALTDDEVKALYDAEVTVIN